MFRSSRTAIPFSGCNSTPIQFPTDCWRSSAGPLCLRSVYFGVTRYVAGSIAIWLGVVSHWVLDLIVHRPDLQLYAHSRMFGLGLWDHRWLTMAIEVALFAIAIWTYQRQTRPVDKIGLYAFLAFVLVLLLAYAGAALGPPPSSVKKLALITLITWLTIPWAWWFDQHREPRANQL